MNTLVRMFRDLAECRLGKINWRSRVWRFNPKKPLVNSIGNTLVRDDDRGRTGATLCQGRAALCHHVEKWGESLPVWKGNDDRRYMLVPQRECRSCEFHEPSRRGRRFSACRWYRENNDIPTPGEMVAKAAAQANEMLGQ